MKISKFYLLLFIVLTLLSFGANAQKSSTMDVSVRDVYIDCANESVSGTIHFHHIEGFSGMSGRFRYFTNSQNSELVGSSGNIYRAAGCKTDITSYNEQDGQRVSISTIVEHYVGKNGCQVRIVIIIKYNGDWDDQSEPELIGLEVYGD